MWSATLFVLLLSSVDVAIASPTTLGCATPDLLSALLGALLGGTFNGIPSASTCATRCAGINRGFSYWSSGNSRCYCANSGLRVDQLTSTAVTVAASSAAPLCAANDYHVQALGFPHVLQACATPSSITGMTVPPTSLRTINECLTLCASSPYALVTLGSASTCTCGRGVLVAPAGLGICQAGSTAVYRNAGVVDPGPSGVRKRRRLAEDKRACPGKLDACLVAGQGEAYECIDSQTELESCGGCVHGALDSVLDRRRGVDCSAIPGVALGGVTCINGRCIISKCKPGHTIVPDKCLRRM